MKNNAKCSSLPKTTKETSKYRKNNRRPEHKWDVFYLRSITLVTGANRCYSCLKICVSKANFCLKCGWDARSLQFNLRCLNSWYNFLFKGPIPWTSRIEFRESYFVSRASYFVFRISTDETRLATFKILVHSEKEKK